MKILILTNSALGLYRFRKELLQELLSQNDTVYLSLPCERETEELAAMGCVLIDTPVDRRGTNIWKDLKLIGRYSRILDRLSPDLVLTYTIKPNIYGGFVCGIRKISYMANITGLGTSIENKGFLSGLAMLLYKTGLRNARTVFFQNQENQQFFQDRKIVRGKTILIPGSGVNLEEHPYEAYPKDQEEILFLFVGRIMRDKGIEELLQCAKQIKAAHKNVRFDIIGEFDEKRYERQMRDLEERQIVTYLGKQRDVHSFMKSHHALIQPSYHEGISNVLLEAAACGRPVIASLVSGCMETFDDGVTGIGFEARNTEALVNAVRRFLTLTREQMEQMGQMGRRKIQAEFDRKFVVGAYMQEIKKERAIHVTL